MKTVVNDWIPRKKYIYIGYNDNHPLATFIEQDVIPGNSKHIIWDKWSDVDGHWTQSEPDTYRRVTAIWQDIAGDFDGDPLVIVWALTPNKIEIKREDICLYTLSADEDKILLNEEETSMDAARKRVVEDIEACLRGWERSIGNSAEVLMLASKNTSDIYFADVLLDNSDPYSNLEYGDVKEGEYQVWSYPSGTIYTMEPDREVDEHDYYSTPYATSGVKWLPRLTVVGKDELLVSEAYRKLSKG